MPFKTGFSDSIDLVFLVAAAVVAIGFFVMLFLPEVPLSNKSGIQAQQRRPASSPAPRSRPGRGRPADPVGRRLGPTSTAPPAGTRGGPAPLTPPTRTTEGRLSDRRGSPRCVQTCCPGYSADPLSVGRPVEPAFSAAATALTRYLQDERDSRHRTRAPADQKGGGSYGGGSASGGRRPGGRVVRVTLDGLVTCRVPSGLHAEDPASGEGLQPVMRPARQQRFVQAVRPPSPCGITWS